MNTWCIRWQSVDWHSGLFTALRVAIGWHFVWEGWIKLSQPTWSAAGYLKGSWGPIAPLLQWISEIPILQGMVDLIIPWSLFLAGLGLMAGLFSRTSIVAAMVLLVMFITATPAYEVVLTPAIKTWTDVSFALENAQWAGKHMIGSEGSYFLVTKNLIEFLALAALLTIPLDRLYGVDSLLRQWDETKDMNGLKV